MKDFFAEIDETGAVVSLEEGTVDDVPSSMLEVVSQIIIAGATETRFLWLPAGTKRACRVTVSPLATEGIQTRSAHVTGTWLDELPAGMTVREVDILTLVALGLSNAEIAGNLTLSTRTVTTHVYQIMQKLGASNRTSAAVSAVDQGLLRVPFPGKPHDALELISLGRILRQGPAASHRVARRTLAPLKIGAVFPLNGCAALDGIEMAQGTQLAVDELNARGIAGRKVELEIISVDVLDFEEVHRALEALAGRQVDALVAGYHAQSSVTQEFAASTGIPYLHSATMDALSERVRDDPSRFSSVFQVCPGDAGYIPHFVETMSTFRAQGLWRPSSRTLAVIRSAWIEADLGLSHAYEVADRNGWELEVMEVDHRDPGGSVRLADHLRRSEPAAAFLGNFLVRDAVTFMNAFVIDPSDTLLYFQYSPSVPEFRRAVGRNADGIVWATVTGTYSDKTARDFAERYTRRFGSHPGRSHAGIAYDRIALLGQAWRAAHNPKDPRAVTGELRRLIHRGVNGVYFLGDESQTALSFPGRTADMSLAQAHLVFQIQEGQHRILSPAPYADSSFRTPEWFSARASGGSRPDVARTGENT